MANIIQKQSFRDVLSVFPKNNYLLMKLECQKFKESMVHEVFCISEMWISTHVYMYVHIHCTCTYSEDRV